jgi:hypothetical protein
MTRHPARALVPLALAATTILLGACGADPTTTEAGAPVDPSPSPPIELRDIGAGVALEPASYAVPLIGRDSPIRAVVDVPAGYFSAGGWVIDDGHGTRAPDEYGDLAFWGAIGQVDPDPCHAGPLEHLGPGVRALTDALESQQGRITSDPQPARLGGYRGVYLESEARGGLRDCVGAQHHLFRAGPGSSPWLTDDLPGTTDRLWIANVNGRRVVAVVQTVRGRTADPAELVGIAESVWFVHAGSFHRQPFRPGP